MLKFVYDIDCMQVIHSTLVTFTIEEFFLTRVLSVTCHTVRRCSKSVFDLWPELSLGVFDNIGVIVSRC